MPKNKLSPPPKSSGFQQAELEAGWIGKIFGIGENNINNVVGLITIILLITIIGLIYLGNTQALGFVGSLFTLAFGFYIGRKTA